MIECDKLQRRILGLAMSVMGFACDCLCLLRVSLRLLLADVQSLRTRIDVVLCASPTVVSAMQGIVTSHQP